MNDSVLAAHEYGLIKEFVISSPATSDESIRSNARIWSPPTRLLDIGQQSTGIRGGIKCPSFSQDGSVLVATIDDVLYLFGMTDVLYATPLKLKSLSKSIRAMVSPDGRSVLAVEYPSGGPFELMSEYEKKAEIKVLVWPEISSSNNTFIRLNGFQADKAL